MLSVVSGHAMHRREMLQIGGATLGGLALPGWLHQPSLAAESRGPVTGKSVIFLFMQGGPSQFETFDPKMDAPPAIRSVTGEIATSIPGVTFGSTFRGLAKRAKKLAIVRSYQTKTGHGSLDPLVSKKTLNANIGSLYSRVLGAHDPRTGMPSSAAIFPNAVDPREPGPRSRFGKIETGGDLGQPYAPLVPGGKGPFLDNLKLSLTKDQFENRRRLLGQLNRLRRQTDTGGFGQEQQRAIQIILNGVSEAFDLSKERPETIARYDTSHFYHPELWNHKNNKKSYKANAMTLGKLLLLARRLCEAGCGFVSVNTEFVWDMHEDKNNLGMVAGMKSVGRPFDHAVSAFIDDVEARGLSEKILLVCVGEMGRTPKLSKKGGRGHWGTLAPMILYGGGLTHGQVIGRSDRNGGKPVTTPLNQANLLSTITHQLYDVGEVRIKHGIPGNVRKSIDKAAAVRPIL